MLKSIDNLHIPFTINNRKLYTSKVQRGVNMEQKKETAYIGDLGTTVAIIDKQTIEFDVDSFVLRVQRRLDAELTWKKDLCVFKVVNYGDQTRNQEIVDALSQEAHKTGISLVWTL